MEVEEGKGRFSLDGVMVGSGSSFGGSRKSKGWGWNNRASEWVFGESFEKVVVGLLIKDGNSNLCK